MCHCFSLLFGFLVFLVTMPKGKHTTIDLDSEEEPSVLSDRSKRQNPNLQTLVEEFSLSRFRGILKRMSLEISSSSKEDSPYEEVDGEETSSGENLGTSTTLGAGEAEASEGSSSEEPRLAKEAKTSYRAET